MQGMNEVRNWGVEGCMYACALSNVPGCECLVCMVLQFEFGSTIVAHKGCPRAFHVEMSIGVWNSSPITLTRIVK